MRHLLTSLLGGLKGLGWWGAAGVSLALSVVSLALAAAIVAQWPADQFQGEAPPFWAHRHPVIRILGLIGKNLLGYFTIALGIVLAFPGVPGQGVVLILIGLTLVNFPGKRRLERRLIGRPSVLRVINRLRHRFHRPPLEIE